MTKISSDATVASLRAMFCTAYARLPDESHHGLQPRAVKCVHLGNSATTPGSYRLLNLESRNIIDTPDVIFNEVEFPFAATTTGPERQRVLSWTWDDALLAVLASGQPVAAAAAVADVAPAVPVPTPPVAAPIAIEPLTLAEVKKMPVATLTKALAERGLPLTGLKAVLVERLSRSVSPRVDPPPAVDPMAAAYPFQETNPLPLAKPTPRSTACARHGVGTHRRRRSTTSPHATLARTIT